MCYDGHDCFRPRTHSPPRLHLYVLYRKVIITISCVKHSSFGSTVVHTVAVGWCPPQTVYNEYISAAKIPGARFTQKRPSSCLCIRYLHNVNAKTKKNRVFIRCDLMEKWIRHNIRQITKERLSTHSVYRRLCPFLHPAVSCEHLLTFQLDPFPRYSLGELNLQSLPYIVQRRSSSKSLHAIKRLTWRHNIARGKFANSLVT